jgi:hypothetical protein
MSDPTTVVIDDIDDIDAHAIDCVCDECVDNLILERQEDRAA